LIWDNNIAGTKLGTQGQANALVILNSTGNVGIGTTGPLSKLDVNGGVAIGSYAGSSAAPANGLIVSGPVGIGKTSGGYPLEVQGEEQIFSGSLTLIGGTPIRFDDAGTCDVCAYSIADVKF